MFKRIDHVVITTARLEQCIMFYKALGFTEKHEGGRYELFAGDFKINVHVKGQELYPHAKNVQTGSADMCFEITEDIIMVKAKLQDMGIKIEQGVVARCGALGEMQSIYLRDPDSNLIELCSYS